MYCVNCGVKLADTENSCPLCNTPVLRLDASREGVQPLYPPHRYPQPVVNSKTVQIILSTITLMALLITLLCDIQINGEMVWSGYVAGALLIGYVSLVLPFWFRKPNPVVFVPNSFLAVVIYLLYINHISGGNWFWSLALPVVGYAAILVTVEIALLRYVKRGVFYILGGGCIALGMLMPLLEYLIHITFTGISFIGWCYYPLIVLGLLGGMLVFLGMNDPARETMERKFFV